MEFIDTHCHLQFKELSDCPQVVSSANKAGVKRLICVGTSLDDSLQATKIAAQFKDVWATVGIHPHEAKKFVGLQAAVNKLTDLLKQPKIVAVGEIGLDYYKNYSPADDQKQTLRWQIEATLGHNLPYIFHVRDAWDDFWPIYDSYPDLKGVIHSFSASPDQLHNALKRGLYVALNGIMTFTKDELQLQSAKQVPLDKLLLETDAPFLAPKPYRGQLCEPKHLRLTAEFLSQLRQEPLEELAAATTRNAKELFSL